MRGFMIRQKTELSPDFRSVGRATHFVLLILALACTRTIKPYEPIEDIRAIPNAQTLERYNGRDNLDFGFYFYSDGKDAEKFIPGKSNRFFDPSKPTVIYIHGWERGTTSRAFRETFNMVDVK